jgi:excisionase family DNA binding protein
VSEQDNDASVRPLLLKIPQACAVLGCSRSALFLLLKNGDLTGVMIGPRQRRISYAECEAYVARLAAEAAAAQHREAS